MFYLARGWKFDEFSGLSFLEKTALRCAIERYYEDERLIHAAAIGMALTGGKEGE